MLRPHGGAVLAAAVILLRLDRGLRLPRRRCLQGMRQGGGSVLRIAVLPDKSAARYNSNKFNDD